jgi:phosphoglycerate kinase
LFLTVLVKKENAAAALKSGEVLLLENLRFHSEEEEEVLLFKTISSLGDIYVNDALNCSQSACFNYHYSPVF